MKMLLRFGTALALAGGMVFAPSVSKIAKVMALPEEQVIQKLQQVPVFTLANSQGQLLTAQEKDNPKIAVAPVFTSPEDAQKFLDQSKQKNSSLANLQVVPLPLSEVYKIQKENKDKPERLVFQFFPEVDQLNAANTILKQQGAQKPDFNGIPIFVGKSKDKEGLMVVNLNNQPVVPFFFDKGQLQTFLQQAQQRQPNAGLDKVEIGVLSLDSVVTRLLSDNDPQLSQVYFVPTQESLDFVRTRSSNTQGQSKPANTPKPAPAAKPQ